MNPLNRIAYNKLEKDSRYYLVNWWTDKYRLPDNHPLLLDKTWEELYIDFMVDYYKQYPQAMKEVSEIDNRGEWKGETTEEHDKYVEEKLKKIGYVDLSRWQDDAQNVEKIEEFDDDFIEDR